MLFFFSEIYERYQNQLPVTIYPSEWFEIIEGCRLTLNNNDQVLFPDQYGEHIFDKRTKINEFIDKLEVPKSFQIIHLKFSYEFRISMVQEVVFISLKNFVLVSYM
jgi:hypothetical protein